MPSQLLAVPVSDIFGLMPYASLKTLRRTEETAKMQSPEIEKRPIL
jgi:hypothetical protein